MSDTATRRNAAGRAVPPQPGGTQGLAAHSGVALPRRPELWGRLASARLALHGNSRRRGHVGFY